MNKIYDMGDLIRRVGSQIEDILNNLYPGVLKRVGSSYKMGDIEGNPGQSFAISAKPSNAGVYYDHANPGINGDIINLVAHRRTNGDRRKAIEWLADYVNLTPSETFESRKKPEVDPNLKKLLHPLHDKGAKAGNRRGLAKATLEKCGVCSTAQGGELLFPHYTEDDVLVMVQHRPISREKKDPYTNEKPGFTLFGKHLVDPANTQGELLITEGHWDMMTWIQIGVPAVSIPSGAGNHNWIATDYHWLSQFTRIILNYDNDEVGQRSAEEAMRRLGPDRCRILKLPRNDANEHLKEGEPDILKDALEEARVSPIPELIDPATFKSKVKTNLAGDSTSLGVQCFFQTLPIRFRPHEWTLWFGYTSHGKSVAVQNQIAYEASIGRFCLVASFEQTPEKTIGSMMLSFTADPAIHTRPYFDEAYAELSEQVRILNSMRRTHPDKLIQVMVAAHSQLGVETFVLDNVMTLDVDRQDNTVQAEVADKLRTFVASYPVHLHCVAHPRKQKDNATCPPNISEVRGASEWVDMPHNVITVFRSTEKHEELEDMINGGGYDNEEIITKDMNTPDGRFYVRKQRETGDMPVARFWFHKPTKRFTPKYGDPISMWQQPVSEPEE